MPLAGCMRQVEPAYEPHAKTRELPDKQQQQIRDSLLRLFGTPLRPRFLLPAETQSAEQAEPQFADRFDRPHLEFGARVFQDKCAGCHGATGDGKGEAAPFLQPKPRDYRPGIFKFTSTPYGAKPTRSDLIRVIRRGAKGTSMPSFAFLPDDQVAAVADYVMMLAYRGDLELKVGQVAATELSPEDDVALTDFVDMLGLIHDQWRQAEEQVVRPLTPSPLYSDDTVAQGRAAFVTRGCSKCHGEDGRGQTDWLSSEYLAQQASLPEDQRPQINYDAWGNVAPAADLTAGMLHGGRRGIDIYRRIHNGINGTPMPSFAQALGSEPETIWHLVHYVTRLVEGKPLPPGTEIPAAGGDEAAAKPSANEQE
jgi:mono/diheme cytochrome c family protein